jgi:hypothetical protein
MDKRKITIWEKKMQIKIFHLSSFQYMTFEHIIPFSTN